MMIGDFQTADEQVSPTAQSDMAHGMISTIGRDAAISACWANQWFGVLEEIYALDRSAQDQRSNLTIPQGE